MSATVEHPAPAGDPTHEGHGHDAHDHGPFFAHHFESWKQQFDAGKLGMWCFLVQEVLFFSGLFCAYAVYRAIHPEVFDYADQFLSVPHGTFNTVVLIFSSMTMAWGVRCAMLGQQRGLIVCLGITLACAALFLGVKAYEYTEKIHAHLIWAGADPQTVLKPGATPTHILHLDKRENPLNNHQLEALLEGSLHSFEIALAIVAVIALAIGVLLYFVRPGKIGAPVVFGCIVLSAVAGIVGMEASLVIHHLSHNETVHAKEQEGPGATPSNVDLLPNLETPEAPEAHAVPLTAAEEGALPGEAVAPTHTGETRPDRLGIFFSIYYVMTGLHAVHIIGGMIVITWLLVRAFKNHFTPEYFGPVDYVGLYWHLVDLVWIYLFPLLYLIG